MSYNTANPRYKWLVLINVMIGTFMVMLDATVVNTALTTIMSDLGCAIDQAEWILTGYMLAISIILPITSWLNDRIGIKNLFIFSISVFTLGSFMCGNSSSIDSLVFWRIFQGAGSGVVLPAGLIIITNVFPRELRSLAMGIWAISTAASISFGPLIGGLLVDTVGWNAIFFLNVPIGLFCIFFSYKVQEKVVRFVKNRFDIIGFITISLFLPVFLLALARVSSAMNTQGWNDPVVVLCLWISGISLLTFIFVEQQIKHPLIDLSVFKNRNFSFSNSVIFIFGMGIYGSSFLIPLYVQTSLGYSAIDTGLLFLPVGLLQVLVSPLAGYLAQRYDSRWVILTGGVILSISYYMGGFFTPETPHRYILLSLCVRGVGAGIMLPPLINVSLITLKQELMAQGSTITNMLRQMGGSVGVAIFSYILTQRRAFHATRFSESVDYSGAAYQTFIQQNANTLSQGSLAGNTSIEQLSNSIILDNINNAAFIQGVDDAFIIGLFISILSLVFVFALRYGKKEKAKQERMETEITKGKALAHRNSK
ncbi:MAG: DHA2 family efflux MFS transporter permease subunit [Marinifilaceae bacterium]